LDTKRQFALAQDNFLRLDYFSCSAVKTRQFALAQSFFDTCTLPMGAKKLFFFSVRDLAEFPQVTGSEVGSEVEKSGLQLQLPKKGTSISP
jgi:hypothetical protein